MTNGVSMIVGGIALAGLLAAQAAAVEPAAFRAGGEPVQADPQGAYVCEAEEFKVAGPGGWQAQPWGKNYYAATFANTFLSRKAFLGAPDQCEPSTATITVNVAEAGRYLVLARYEAAYRFETQFNVKVEQAGKVLQDRLYGARDNVKVWAFREGLKKEVAWPWGAVENVVWEGNDAFVDLQAGAATITLVAGKQQGNAAKRNVDLILLTRNAADVNERIAKEAYLPLDGLLTQQGDVFAKVTNTGSAPINVTVGGWQEHSPYWIHTRDPKVWKPIPFAVAPGQSSEWTDIGGAMDSLNDGHFAASTGAEKAAVDAAAPFKIEFVVKDAAGKMEPIGTFDVKGSLNFAAFADTRYSRKVGSIEQPLYDLLAYLEKLPQVGKAPSRTLIYGYTFSEIPGNAKYNAAIDQFKKLYSLQNVTNEVSTYWDVRGIETAKLAEECAKIGEKAKQVEVVSLGDEIGLPAPDAAAAGDGFRAYLKAQPGLKASDVDPAAGEDWTKINYNPAPELKQSNPGLYYWSARYLHNYGIVAMKARTAVLKSHLPRARVGANYSPHHGGALHSYLGPIFQWVTCFREGGMELPWSEDYIWQLPVGTPQMNGINLALFRAGNRGKPERDLLYYVMPHSPGNTPRMWRRLYHNALGGGMTIINLFEFRPVQNAYTENHVTGDGMYGAVLTAFRELGTYEDIVQDGQVRLAETALWFSETADIWGDNAGSFAAGKRGLYVSILQNQAPVDAVAEEDAADGTLAKFKVLYLTDSHVTQAASKKIAEWVKAGGQLFATAGAGMFDELNKPNTVMRELIGVDQKAIESPADAQIGFIKQDLPFAREIGQVTFQEDGAASFPVFGTISRIAPTAADAKVIAKFADGSPAATHRAVDKGEVTYCAFLPALSYFRPAIPLKPVDRGSSDDAMAHFIPTAFDANVGKLVGRPLAAITKPVTSDQPHVAASIIEAKQGTMIVLENWSDAAKKGLKVTANVPLTGAAATLGSGKPITMEKQGDKTVFTLDLEEGDVIVLR